MLKPAILSFCLFFSTGLMSQPFNLNPDINPVELKFKEHFISGTEKPVGRISINELRQETDTAYYFINGISMYAPTYVAVAGNNDSINLKIDLCKENWRQPHRSGSVQGKKKWEEKFKTEGDIGIRVITMGKPVRYGLVVFTGNDMEITLPDAFAAEAAEKNSGTGGWLKKNLLLLGLGLAVVVLMLLFIRKKKAKK
ncbi:MAG: hypothetical protein JNM68_07930 [Dinghuibacter sp.]|nr:hypothetical protein [Dinghuibacter sp.]